MMHYGRDVISRHALLIQHRVDPYRMRPLAVAAEGPFAHSVARASRAPGDRGGYLSFEIFIVQFPKELAEIEEPAFGFNPDLVWASCAQLFPVLANETTKARHLPCPVLQIQDDLVDDLIARAQEYPVKPEMQDAFLRSHGQHGRRIVRENKHNGLVQALFEKLPKRAFRPLKGKG